MVFGGDCVVDGAGEVGYHTTAVAGGGAGNSEGSRHGTKACIIIFILEYKTEWYAWPA